MTSGQKRLNPISLTCAPIEVFAPTGKSLAIGSSFFFSKDADWVYLVTNWHMVTGRNNRNPRETSTGAVPVKYEVRLHRKFDGDTMNPLALIRRHGPLNSEDGEFPLWLEHPEHGPKVDLAVLKIPNDAYFQSNIACRFITDISSLEPRFSPAVTDDVFVVGYPWGLTGGGRALPLYKRGSVASEPAIDIGNLPQFYIDCRTSDSMSGSPVICSRHGLWSPDGTFSDETHMNGVESFAGVYSGRLIETVASSDGTGSQREISEIGIVWKAAAVADIVDRGALGTKLSEMAA